MKTLVMLVDDHQLVREGLREVLGKQPDIDVIGEASNGREAIELARKLQPDVVVMDIAMPVMNGIDATERIIAVAPNTRVLILSMHGHRRVVMEALRAGATGYLLKDCAADGLAHAIRTVRDNLTFLSPQVADGVLQDFVEHEQAAQQSKPELTKREQQVLKLLAEGCSAREIAVQLGLSTKTIETHRRRIMHKLEVDSLAALTKQAIRDGLTSLDV